MYKIFGKVEKFESDAFAVRPMPSIGPVCSSLLIKRYFLDMSPNAFLFSDEISTVLLFSNTKFEMNAFLSFFPTLSDDGVMN